MIFSLKINKAHGDDGMGSVMLKEFANELKCILTITDYVDQGYPVDVIFLDFQDVKKCHMKDCY